MILLAATTLVPLLMLAACAWPQVRARMPFWLGVAPLPGLATACFATGDSLVFYADWLRLSLLLDHPSAMLLGVASLLWSAAGIYAGAYLGHEARAGRFACWWLLTLAGSLGVFIAGDVITFYLAFALVSLSAYGLVAHDDTAAARRAGSIYLLLAVMGEVFLLLGFALLSANVTGSSLAIADAIAALPGSPWRDATVALLILGFGLKAGLVPLHVWLPLAHPAAPMPASAVLSGVIIKAGIMGLIRFLPFEAGLEGWGVALGTAGFVTAFWGVAVGLTQQGPKTVLAYSSVSQMGVVMAVLGFGLAAGDATAPGAGAFYAAHHVLAKGALFLGVGVALSGARPVLVWPAVVLLVMSFGGMPLTGGALAKLAIKPWLGDGVLAWMAALSAVGTTLLLLHFFACLRTIATERSTRFGLLWPWLGTTLVALLLPWLLFPGSTTDAFDAKAMWGGLWPVLLGAALFALLRYARLPALPEGDVLVLAERAINKAGPPIGNLADRVERRLRTWPSAGLALLTLAVAFGAAMVAAAP